MSTRSPSGIRITALVAAAFLSWACSDRPPAPTAPNGDVAPWAPRTPANITPGTCVSLSTLYAEANAVFSAGGPDANSVKSKIDQIDKANKKGDRTKANDAAFNTVRFIFQKFRGPQPLAGSPEQVAKLISDVFCFAGLDIVVDDPFNANLIDPSSQTQVVKSADQTAGTSLPANSITEPTILEFKKLPTPQTLTRLDQYPGFVAVTASSASNSGPAIPVVVAVCPDVSVPASIRSRLRLGHQRTAGFEITPPADASFLTCPTSTASAGGLRGWVDKALNLVLPRTLYAAPEAFFTGGVGGTASEFSPFAPVDPFLSFTGGVGGTAGEFILTGPRGPRFDPSPRRPLGSSTGIGIAGTTANVAVPCAAAEAVWSTPLAPECRPGIVIRTANGTVMRNVPVSWTVTAGGGTVAPEDPATRNCGTFALTANTTTSDTGRAGICWTMGPTPGANAATATPSAGGDAPAGVTFTPASIGFSALAIKATPVVALTCPAVATHTGADQSPCSASASDPAHAIGLGPLPVSYSPSPVNAVGPYAATATYTATSLYNAASASASFAVEFADGFEAALAWTTGGLWNRSTLKTGGGAPIVNVALPDYVSAPPGEFPGGLLPSPATGTYAAWFGAPADGNYLPGVGGPLGGGGTSATAISGTVVSSAISVTSNPTQTVTLAFDTWWEIESVNPSAFDIMTIAIEDVSAATVTALGSLNPATDPTAPTNRAKLPYTSGGFNAPPVWMPVSVNLDDYRGKTIRVRFSFDTRDPLYNGFRGWVVDNVRVFTSPAAAALRAAPGDDLSPSRTLNPLPPVRPRP